MKNLFIILPLMLGACSTIKNNTETRKLSRSAYYDWSVSYNCGNAKLDNYYDANQRLCKFWEVMDSGDYLFAESFINGMKEDNFEQRVLDLVKAHLLIRQGKIAEAKDLVVPYKDDKYFRALRVYVGLDTKLETLGEYNQMEILAKIKGNLRIGMTYEAWKLLKHLHSRTRDPWIVKQMEILKTRNPSEKLAEKTGEKV